MYRYAISVGRGTDYHSTLVLYSARKGAEDTVRLLAAFVSYWDSRAVAVQYDFPQEDDWVITLVEKEAVK